MRATDFEKIALDFFAEWEPTPENLGTDYFVTVTKTQKIYIKLRIGNHEIEKFPDPKQFSSPQEVIIYIISLSKQLMELRK